MSEHAAVTIVSKNYLAFAQTLAQSYLQHHPGHDFIVLLVDRADGYVGGRLECGAEVIELANVAIPDIGRFIYRYSIMELNTAVKPFVMADLFRRRRYRTVLYIDPDIFVFRPLEHVYEALERASVVLTPHIRRPYFDRFNPSDLAILQSGTYNLGFVGLRRGETADRFLDWWMSKLHVDCVVDIPKGLFVDQKWVDLLPGFTPDHAILSEPGYNAAYWNLHERPISREDGEWLAGGEPLYFFHFSGYSPFAPHSLSKHQNRHQLTDLPDLKALTDFYGRKLFDNGYADSSAWPYAFEYLGNGVRLPMGLVNAVMQWAVRNRVNTPCPIAEPDQFCRFLMSRGLLPNAPRVILLFHFLLRARADVASAFPDSVHDSSHPGLRDWIAGSGQTEMRIDRELLAFEDLATQGSPVTEMFRLLRQSGNAEILAELRNAWGGVAEVQRFRAWLESPLARMVGVTDRHVAAFGVGLPGVSRILNLYFLRADLQSRYPVLWTEGQQREFVGWLMEQRFWLDLKTEQVALFAEFLADNARLFESMRYLYQHRGAERKSPTLLYAVDRRRGEIGAMLTPAFLADLLARSRVVDALDHFLEAFPGDRPSVDDPSRYPAEGLDHRRAYMMLREAEELLTRRTVPVVNLAGYLSAPSGMGESGRSMQRTLEAGPFRVRGVCLPHARAEIAAPPSDAFMFGWPASGAELSITVANADAVKPSRQFLPASFHARRNVAYWVWETEALPARFGRAGESFDEIWTPSLYSASAIRVCVDRPVQVLPHALDLAALDAARSRRVQLGLPENSVLLGFMFDPESGLERKNVAGLMRAFESAFRPDDDCYLVLKVNGRVQGDFDYEMMRARATSDRILFLERQMDRADTFDFLASLDAYVSLHRAEGFGLTCAEAMGLGVPVVASGYSGNLEFMDEHNSLLVPTRVVETDRPFGPYPVGTRWADPDRAAACAALRSLLDADYRRQLGLDGRASVRARLAPEVIAKKAEVLVAALLSRDGKSTTSAALA